MRSPGPKQSRVRGGGPRRLWPGVDSGGEWGASPAGLLFTTWKGEESERECESSQASYPDLGPRPGAALHHPHPHPAPPYSHSYSFQLCNFIIQYRNFLIHEGAYGLVNKTFQFQLLSMWLQKDYMRGRFGAIFINQKSRELHRDNIWAVFSAKWSKRFSIFVKDYLTNWKFL